MKFSIEITTSTNISDLPNPEIVKDIYIVFVPGGNYRDILNTAKKLIEKGYNPVPHFAARSIKNLSVLKEYSSLCKSIGIAQILVIGGGSNPIGEYHCSMQLIETGLLDNFKICIAGHPEGAPNISDKQLQDAMSAKINYAERIITQWTLNIDAINKFVKTAELPTHVGLLGPTSIKSLLKFANLVGSKNSLEFIKNNITKIPTLIKKQEPKNIIDKLDSRINSIHFYTFGGITKTSQWVENYFKKTVSKNQPY